MDNLTKPHDKYFRASMSDLRVAKTFLQAHLPEKILAKIDWPSLRVAPDHHVDKHLSETITDIVYQVNFGKDPGYIMILVEHQSTIDPLMPFRMLDYSISIMRDYMKEHPGRPLPLVVPLVFYSGKTPYNCSTDVFELFGEQETLARETFLNPFHLIDVGSIPDEELRQHTWAGVMELVQKYIWERDFLPIMKDLAPLLRELASDAGNDYIYATLKYVSSTANLNDFTEFATIIDKEVSSELGENVMSLASMLRTEGREEGRVEGRETGREEGREAGETIGLKKGKIIGFEQGREAAKKRMAKEMLNQGAELEFVSKVTDLTIEELESL